jgi:endonuclease/exonuclease/phosphatase family metal-dependent hydrolase
MNVGSKKLNLFNAHGVWGTDGRDNSKRLMMSRIITEKIRGKKNVILSGDFNADIYAQTIRNIEKHLRNVFKYRLKSSFNLKHKSDKFGEFVVDMVLTSRDIEITESYCPSADVPDHMPLVIVFDF